MLVATFALDPRPGEYAGNLEQALQAVEQAAARGAVLLALPELWPTSFLPAGHAGALEATVEAVEKVAARAGELGVVVVGSALADSGQSKPFNRAHVLEGGEVVAFHDKVHLFSPTAEPAAFTAGVEPPPVVDTGAGRLGAMVCYDVRFPELSRVVFRGGAELLVVVAQWPGVRAPHWRSLCMGRAVEGQMFVLGANRRGDVPFGRTGRKLEYVGNGLIVSPDGELLGESTAAEPLLVVDIDLEDVHRQRKVLPIAKDERPGLYDSWPR
ncbi:MAG: omega-amidase [Planctomycetota bacterium]|jgi:omega-amidase